MSFDFHRPPSPRRQLWGGLVLTALGALQVGLGVDRAVAAPGFSAAFYLACSAAFTACGVLQFREALRRLPADPPPPSSDTARDAA